MDSHNRHSIILEVMPQWNGRESIVAYSIRMRREREARAARARLITAFTLIAITPLVMAGTVGFVAALMGWIQ